jgi:peptide/nickel transport system permease protein
MRPQGKHEMSDTTSATRPADASTPGSSTPHAPGGADAVIAAGAGIAAAMEAPPSLRWRWLRKHPTLILGIVLLLLIAALSLAAPWIATHNPTAINPLQRLKPASSEHWFGTDALGRDVFSRAVWGGRVSLIVAISVAVLATVLGVALGLTAGFVRWADSIIMRIMDGLMAIPDILLAIALMAVIRASLSTVILAITIPQVPRVVRLVRSLALSLREQLFVEAAHAIGTRLPVILVRHVLPNIVTPLIVQATFIAATAVLTEAVLSFLGVGVPAQVPSWGNMMAEGRNFVAVAFTVILYPGMLLALTVLAINLMGDGLRDALDPRLANQL